MEQGSGKSFIIESFVVRATSDAQGASQWLTGMAKSFHSVNEKRKRDPHTPAIRSKGEKARNRHKRFK